MGNAIGLLCVKWNIMPVSVCMYVCVSFVHVCLSVVYVGIYNSTVVGQNSLPVRDPLHTVVCSSPLGM